MRKLLPLQNQESVSLSPLRNINQKVIGGITNGRYGFYLRLKMTFCGIIWNQFLIFLPVKLCLQAEVTYLGRLHHENIIKLVGYCAESDSKILVYEYMPGGSLANHLFSK